MTESAILSFKGLRSVISNTVVLHIALLVQQSYVLRRISWSRLCDRITIFQTLIFARNRFGIPTPGFVYPATVDPWVTAAGHARIPTRHILMCDLIEGEAFTRSNRRISKTATGVFIGPLNGGHCLRLFIGNKALIEPCVSLLCGCNSTDI